MFELNLYGIEILDKPDNFVNNLLFELNLYGIEIASQGSETAHTPKFELNLYGIEIWTTPVRITPYNGV